MITYRHEGLMPFKITVKLDRKIIGAILKVPGGGYRFHPGRNAPKGAAFHENETFATVPAVKRSIEA